MQLSPKQIEEDEGAYAAAFDEDMQVGSEQSDDEAFGLSAEPETQDEPELTEGQATDAVSESATDEPTTAEGEQPPETADDGAPRQEGESGVDMAGGDDIEKERQRLKSWEGRLKKMQEELKAQTDARAAGAAETNGPAADGTNTESTTADAVEQVADKAAASGDSEMAAAAQEVADQVAAGEITPEQAMRTLSEDFGEDFVKLIEAVARASAGKVADERVGAVKGELGKAVSDIVADITDTKARAHFEAIATAHPDFDEIGKSAEFRSYIDSLPQQDKANAERVVQRGSAKEIVKLLSDFKASGKDDGDPTPTSDPAVDAAADAAAGVRSTGMRLPEQPKPAADSYEDAWKEFA